MEGWGEEGWDGRGLRGEAEGEDKESGEMERRKW